MYIDIQGNLWHLTFRQIVHRAALGLQYLSDTGYAGCSLRQAGLMQIFSYTSPIVQVDTTSESKLHQPLLQFHEDSTAELPLLTVNFDPALVRLLRETKYFLLLKIEVSKGWAPCCFKKTATVC